MTKKELTALAEACNRFFSQPEEEVTGILGITMRGREISADDYKILEPFFDADVEELYKVGEVKLKTKYRIGKQLMIINGKHYVSMPDDHLYGLRRVIKNVFMFEEVRRTSSKRYYKKTEVTT